MFYFKFILQDGSLALASVLHSEVALLVAEAYQKYLTDKPYSGLISEGIKQVTCWCFLGGFFANSFSTEFIYYFQKRLLFSTCRCLI